MTDYERGRAEERARIVWWLRAGAEGPASVGQYADEARWAGDLADVIEAHPERFNAAPVALAAERRREPNDGPGTCTCWHAVPEHAPHNSDCPMVTGAPR